MGNSHKKNSTPSTLYTDEELKNRLSGISYKVTQKHDTERPFTGEYTTYNKKGIYQCIVCNEDLFK